MSNKASEAYDKINRKALKKAGKCGNIHQPENQN